MEGWVGLVGWPIADALPTKWLHVNHGSGVDQGKSASQRPTFLPLSHAAKSESSTFLSVFAMLPLCRPSSVRGGGCLHPVAVWGEEPEFDEGDLLPPDVRHRHHQYPVCFWRCHRRHHRQQPPRLRSLLTAMSHVAVTTACRRVIVIVRISLVFEDREKLRERLSARVRRFKSWTL